MRRILTPMMLNVQHRLSILWKIHKSIFSFLENFTFALLILVCEFYNHFGGTAIFFEVRNFCQFLKEIKTSPIGVVMRKNETRNRNQI